MPQLTEWLKLMLAEIARKQEESARATAEEAARGTPSPSRSQKEPPKKEPPKKTAQAHS